MPIYEYECTVCDKVYDELRSMKDRNVSGACPVCAHEANRILSAPAGIDGGFTTGYVHRSGKTGVWKTDMGPQGEIGKQWYGDNSHAPSTLEKK